MPRIIAGEFRSRRLQTLDEDDLTTRPYADRVKESVFNLLRGWFDDANVLDLFAGVGTMGLEAVSRGAKRAVMVEQNRRVLAVLKENIAAFGCGDRAEAVLGDALSSTALVCAPKPVDVVFIDPPYALMERTDQRRRVMAQIARCRNVMGDEGFVVLRSPIDPEGETRDEWVVEGFSGPEVHRHSHEMWVLLYSPEPGGD